MCATIKLWMGYLRRATTASTTTIGNTNNTVKQTPLLPPSTTVPTQQPQTILSPVPTEQETTVKKTVSSSTNSEEQSIEERIAHIRDMQDKLGAFQSGMLPLTPSTQTTATATQSTIPEHNNHPTEERLIGGTGGIRIRGAHSLTQQPPRNIIALTKGFIEKHHGENGTDLIDRDGDPHKRPSFEELKYLSYEANINWSLQAAWKQNFSHSMMKRYPSRMEAVIEFTLDKQGNIIKSELLHSTGYREIDTMIMKNTNLASPFPPLPHHFETPTYTTGRVIHVYSEGSEF
jgi:TonB family protein